MVDLFWDFADNPEDKSHKNAFLDPYDLVICWQVMPSSHKLCQSVCQNIVLVPMYEHVQSYTIEQWRPYLSYKILSFSKTLHVMLRTFGATSLNVQFFPAPIKQPSKKENGLNVFFWQRSAELDFTLIKKILPSIHIRRFQMHRTHKDASQDVWFRFPSQEDIDAYHMCFSSWFDTKEEMTQALDTCDIYIAPRMYEGIGMGFLEAMAMGKCVIAPNLPTMNEYIVHGENGWLFDPFNPSQIDISKCASVGEKAFESIVQGHQRWRQSEESIIQFLFQPHEKEPVTTPLFAHNANMIFSRNLNFIDTYLRSKNFSINSVVLYGAGTGAVLLSGLLQDKVAYIVDIDVSKHGTRLCGHCIDTPSRLQSDEKMIVISVFGREKKILHYLRDELGIDTKRILTLDLFH